MAAFSLANEAAHTVANPSRDGIAVLAVEIPIAFCAAVETAKVPPKAEHPAIIENAASGMALQSFPNENSRDLSSLLSPYPMKVAVIVCVLRIVMHAPI